MFLGVSSAFVMPKVAFQINSPCQNRQSLNTRAAKDLSFDEGAVNLLRDGEDFGFTAVVVLNCEKELPDGGICVNGSIQAVIE